jgi:nucleotide-binding universal stress UspA family protein
MGLAMRDPYVPPPAVVVGFDGSRSAMQAALWAVDEAVDRDVVLQLVYAIDSPESAGAGRNAELATAERVVHQASTAIESTGKPVKLEADIVHGHPITALREASRSATMLCVGSTGLRHSVTGRTGSTASALASSAHCPVAIVPTSGGPMPDGWILAVPDGAPAGTAVVELAASEAALRDAPLRVLNAGRTAGRNGVAAQFDRRVAAWQRNHPDVVIESTTPSGNVVDFLEYLHRHAESVQLVVVGPGRAGDLLGPAGRAALDATRCSVLIGDRQCWL